MFEGNGFGIPEDKFDYLQDLICKHGVTLTTVETPGSMNLDIEYAQKYDDIIARYTGGQLRELTISDSYVHQKVIMTKGCIVREIQFAVHKEVRNAEGIFVSNSELDIPRNAMGLYTLACYVWSLCRHSSFLHLVNDSRYLWAKEYGIANRLDEDCFNNSFQYSRDVVLSIIDIFGKEDTLAMADYFLNQ
jgi:hypothetical protein